MDEETERKLREFCKKRVSKIIPAGAGYEKAPDEAITPPNESDEQSGPVLTPRHNGDKNTLTREEEDAA